MFKYYLYFSEHIVLPWNLTKILIWGLERQVGVAKEKNSECGLERGVSKRGRRPVICLYFSLIDRQTVTSQ